MDKTHNVIAYEVTSNSRTKVFDVEAYPAAEDWYFAQKSKGVDVDFRAVIELDD